MGGAPRKFALQSRDVIFIIFLSCIFLLVKPDRKM